MTVSSQKMDIRHNCDGITTSFPVPFYFLANSDLRAILTGADGTETPLVYGTDFTATGAGNEDGGQITTTQAYPTGANVYIWRVVPITQETDYQPNDAFPERAHEKALDKLTMIAQQLGRVLGFLPGSGARALMLGPADDDGAGAYRANSNRISDVGMPTKSRDAVNKQHLDETLSAYAVDGAGQVVVERLADQSDPNNGVGMVAFALDSRRLSEDTDPGQGDSLVAVKSVLTGSVARTQHDKNADVVSVFDFMTPAQIADVRAGTAAIDVTVPLQRALDSASGIFLPEGVYKISNTLYLNDNNFISGTGRDSKIYAFFDGRAFAGKEVTPASGTNVRRFSGGGRDFYLEGPGPTFSNSIGLDMRGCSMFKWINIQITRFDTGVIQGLGLSTYYNEYYGVDITSVRFGWYSDALGNENLVVGGRVTDCQYGTRDGDNSHNKYVGLAIETFTQTGHLTVSPATTHIQFIGSRLENPPTSGAGIVIDATSQDTVVVGAACISLATNITDNGIRSVILSSEHFNFSGTKITKHLSISATLDFPSIPAGGTNDQFVGISGALPSDSVFVTASPSIPAGVMCMALPATGGLYVRVANVTGVAVDMASLTFRVDIWRH